MFGAGLNGELFDSQTEHIFQRDAPRRKVRVIEITTKCVMAQGETTLCEALSLDRSVKDMHMWVGHLWRVVRVPVIAQNFSVLFIL